jgi:dTMP kinase
MSQKGKFIVMEGLDGAGTETQTKALVNYFKVLRTPVRMFSYPDYDGPIGKLIDEFLHGKYDLEVETQFILYFADFLKNAKEIRRLLEQGETVISDRYLTSTLAYQGLKGFPVENGLKAAELFNLPKPDLVIYLGISSGTSMKRKLEEKGNLDRHEADKDLLTRVGEFYEKLANDNVFGKWLMIDGEKSREEIFEEIKSNLGC